MDTASSDMIDTSKKHNMYLLLVLTVLVLSSGGLAEPGGAEKAAAPKPEDQQFLVIVTRQVRQCPQTYIQYPVTQLIINAYIPLYLILVSKELHIHYLQG